MSNKLFVAIFCLLAFLSMLFETEIYGVIAIIALTTNFLFNQNFRSIFK